MNKLKAKTVVDCATCHEPLKRVKTVSVISAVESEAIKEAEPVLKAWKESLKGTNCKVCKSIISDLKN